MVYSISRARRRLGCVFALAAILSVCLGSALAQATQRVGIVYSEPSANQFYDKFAYTQLFMAMQQQARMAGVPYDLLSEDDLTDIANLTGYTALLIPNMAYVTATKLSAIENTLNEAVFAHGIGLIVGGSLLAYDETGGVFAGNPYARMNQLLGLEYASNANGVAMDVRAADVTHPAIRDYTTGEVILSYEQIWFSSYQPVNGQSATVLATLDVAGQTHNGVIATQTGGRNVHFANDQVLADTNLVWPALRWVLYGDQPAVGLQMGRQPSIFVARNDMDQSMYADTLNLTEIPLYDLLADWKNAYNFVGSYYLNIGDNPAAGQYTDWSVSGPLYTDYIALGNEIGTHSWTHPLYTSLLTDAELEYEFNQSKIEIGNQLGIEVLGAAIPGNPETLEVDLQLEQYLNYISGRSSVVGSGYPGAFGRMRPTAPALYFSLNMSPDFTLIEWLGLTPAQAEATWQDEYLALLNHTSQPVVHWMWHDYGPTISVGNGYTVEMFVNTIALAFSNDSEFITVADLYNRILSYENAILSVTGSDPINVDVNALGVGQFSLKVDASQPISAVTDWYAYSNDRVFVADSGGQFNIQLGQAPADVTHISALPMRARLLDLTGDGNELSFSFEGEGSITVTLSSALAASLDVQGADSFNQNGDQLTLQFANDGVHSVALTLAGAANTPPVASDLSVTTDQDIPVTIDLVASDADADALTYSVLSGPSQGQLSGTAPNLTYTPNAGFNGTDSFTFKANDGLADSNVATVDITVNFTTSNQPPQANDASVTTSQDTAVAITLTASDPESDPLTYSVVSNPLNGQLSGAAPNLTYLPNTGFTGSDSFTFIANDGGADSNTANVSITVTSAGDPVSNPVTGITIDGDLADWSGLVSFGPDPNDITGTNNPIDWLEGWMAHDDVSLYMSFVNDGPITLGWGHSVYLDTDANPATGYDGGGVYPIGADFLIQGSDFYQYSGTGADWSWQPMASLGPAVSGNQAEYAISLAQLGNPSEIHLYFLGENVAYPSGDAQDFYPDGVLTPGSAVRFFRYTVQASSNTAPTAGDQALATSQDTSIAVALTATDPDGDPLTYTVLTNPSNGQLTGTAPDLTYTPTLGFSGNDSFTFKANDGVVDSNTATISVTVTPNDGRISNPVTSLTVDGDLADWAGLTSFGPDGNDVTGANNPIDWLEGWLAHDSSNLYLAYRNDGPISLGWGHNIYLDTDASAGTGYTDGGFFPIGADYLIQGDQLYQYLGSGSDWNWATVATLTSAVNSDQVEFILPRAQVGDPTNIDLFFLGENVAYPGGDTEDYYPDDVANPGGSLRFFGYAPR